MRKLMKGKKYKILNFILPVVVVFALVILWWRAAKTIDNQYILPSVKSTVEEFFALFKSRDFYRAFSNTLFRSLVAFTVSFVIAFALAVATLKVRYVKSAVSPLISIMRALPTIAIVLLLLFWTNSKIAPVIVTALVVLPTSYTQIDGAFSSLDKMVVEAGRVDGANEFQVFLKIELPMIMPMVFSCIGSGISLNFKLMVAAEVISQTAYSLGYMLNTSKIYFETATMLALVLATVVFGVLIEALFNKLSSKSGEWK